jgi:hypothetical protein
LRLTGRSFEQLFEALRAAFPTYGELSIVVRTSLGVNLADIVSKDGGQRKQVAELITWADSRGRAEELLEKAREANPKNPLLADLELEFVEQGEENAVQSGMSESEPSRQSVITDSIIAGGDVKQQSGGINFGSGDIHIDGPVAGRDIHIGTQNVIQAAEKKPPPMQIPRRARHFHGRSQLIADVLAEIHPGRLLTLHGIGGIGKTAVVAEVAGQLQETGDLQKRFPDGVIFHTFYGRPSADAALAHVLNSLGVELKGDIDSAARAALGGRQLLLILDGAEEVGDLRRAPGQQDGHALPAPLAEIERRQPFLAQPGQLLRGRQAEVGLLLRGGRGRGAGDEHP